MLSMLMFAALAVNEPKCPLPGEWALDPETSDEFNGAELDHEKWWDYLPHFVGRKTYFNHGRNVKVKDGCLELWTVRESDPEKMPYGWLEEGREPYSTAAVKSRRKVKGGYFECRMKMNTAPVRGAFWLYDPLSDKLNRKYAPGEYSEEIDICEVEGRHQGADAGKPYLVNNYTHHYVTPYYEGVCNHVNVPYGKKTYFDEDLSQDFHTYGLYWGEEELVWYFDGKETYRIAHNNSSYGGFYRPLHVVLDSEIVDWGLSRCLRPPIDQSLLPSVEKIDWVRHWVEKPRPRPSPQLLARIRSGENVIGIVHFTVNTFTDREWGYGSESPSDFNPTAFDAEQIVRACRDGGIGGLVIVAKHHDGFCLWPTKTTGHNISKSPFRGGKGDYVKEMELACRKYGLKFGVYCSPWDRNNAAYATPAYVKTYHAQVEELNDGRYGEIFEMWFDGANGGDGYYGGAWERRNIGKGAAAREYYDFAGLLPRVRELQPNVCFFGAMGDGFCWPGNESGIVPPTSGATRDDGTFRVYEADFPLRPGWFYHKSQDGYTRSGEFLMKIYLRTVGNGATMDIGIAPDQRGLLADEDVASLKRFTELREAFFANKVASAAEPFNVVEMTEDIAAGERVDAWRLTLDGREIAAGGKIGMRRIRVLDRPVSGSLKLEITKGVAKADEIKVSLYRVDEALVKAVQDSQEPKRPPSPFERCGVLMARTHDMLRYMVKHPKTTSALLLTPDTKNLGGTPVSFRLAWSKDGEKWTEDPKERSLDNVAANPIPQRIELGAKADVKYVKLTVLRTLKDGSAAALARIDLLP